MKIELIPTISSLLQQDAISVSGDKQLIEKLSEQIAILTHFIPSFSNSTYPEPFLMLFHQPKIPLLTESIDRPLSKQVLYSIKLTTEAVELLAHIHNEHDTEIKTVFNQVFSSLKESAKTQHQLYFALGRSPHFTICQQCQQLVASELCCNGACHVDSSMEPHQHCDTTYKQIFDTNLVDRISSSRSSDGHVGIFKDTAAGEIKFYITMTSWPHPHEPVDCNRVIATLPLSATYDEVTRLKLKLENEQQYPAPCFHCKVLISNRGDGMDLASFVDFDTEAKLCFSCASVHYGVVY
ncbi:hypothetical protein [Shewanella sp. GutDb-MelDb]|uniref:hypothetical protein n=1 Tax=Shewanella sp. GutDb-MelDb TaxID=2058316 RepID=UPI000C7DDA9E|nr:hypothetical protein [Shewanella sp. GutDb-MelDb]PKG58110.1 hypothetical protein CXF82_06205 [Shewanella sp. GutDb-MelDb]